MQTISRTKESLLVIPGLCLIYYILRMLTSNLSMAFYDEGETLYHLLSMLEGRVPYRDDHTHHFLGYIFPYILLEKIRGFGIHLVRELAFINQVLMAYGVFLILRIYSGFGLSFIGALLAISAREPFVISFYQTTQCVLLFVYVVLFSLLFLKTSKSIFFYLACFLDGLLLCFDQRALLFAYVPFLALFLWDDYRSLLKKSGKAILGKILYISTPLICLGYLYRNDALQSFIEQCFIFPIKFRAGSQSFYEKIMQGLRLHDYLITDTVIVFGLGLIGFAVLMMQVLRGDKHKSHYLLILSLILPVFGFAVVGGRQYEYYTVLWLPYLAILSVLTLSAYDGFSAFFRKVYLITLLAPVFLALIQAVALKDLYAGYKGDGVQETVQFLQSNVKQDDTLMVWGYRPEIYARLLKLSAYPFASTIMVSPDGVIKEEREKHVYPEYERQFFEAITAKPATFIVKFFREGSLVDSKADRFINQQLSDKYSRVFSISKRDLTQKSCEFEVFKLKNE